MFVHLSISFWFLFFFSTFSSRFFSVFHFSPTSLLTLFGDAGGEGGACRVSSLSLREKRDKKSAPTIDSPQLEESENGKKKREKKKGEKKTRKEERKNKKRKKETHKIRPTGVAEIRHTFSKALLPWPMAGVVQRLDFAWFIGTRVFRPTMNNGSTRETGRSPPGGPP